MKVAIVGPYPLPDQAISGGVERVVDTLIQHLSKHVAVTLIVPNSKAETHTEVYGVPVLYLARTAGPGLFTYWTSDAQKVAKVVNEIRPDIVHFQGVSGVARRVTWPSVLTVHGIAHRDLLSAQGRSIFKRAISYGASELSRRVEQHYRKRIGNVIVINPYVISALPDIVALRQFLIPNPIDRTFTQHALPTEPRRRRIISVGRVGLRKQSARAVAIAARVLDADPSATASFYGRPDSSAYQEYCKRIADEFGVSDRLTFPGNVTAKQLRHDLDAASVFLMASRQETAPVAIAEALARGVAVLAPEEFGISHMIVPGENGFFLEGLNPDNDAKVLAKMLERPWNREKIAEHAREIYGPESVAQRTFETYCKILKYKERRAIS